MSDTNWRSGPPPSIGWWPTAFVKGDWVGESFIRWWDGKRWSPPAFQGDANAGKLNVVAKFRSPYTSKEIFWSPRPSNWLPRSFT